MTEKTKKEKAEMKSRYTIQTVSALCLMEHPQDLVKSVILGLNYEGNPKP